MIANALNDLKRVKYKSHKVYIHNFARFDAIFLLKELVKVGEVNTIIHKGRIVTISLTFTNENNTKSYVIDFRDSYQILIGSLKKLGKLKLENISTRAIFISQKVYYLKTIDNKEIYKIKGLNKNIPVTQLDF